jgi:hypothetical protein
VGFLNTYLDVGKQLLENVGLQQPEGIRETLNSSHTLHRTSFLCFHKPFRLYQVIVFDRSL